MTTPFDLTRSPETDPTTAYRYRDGLYAADLLAAAMVWLDFFTWLGSRELAAEEICEGLVTHARPTDVMITLFCAMGFLERIGSRVRLSRVAREHLVTGSPWFLGPYYASLKDRPITKDFVQVLRTDRPANWGGLGHEKEWSKAMEGEAFATQFTAAMDCRGVYLGQALASRLDLADFRHVLDVAGGSGIYACALAAQHPHLKATVMDRQPVDQLAKTLIRSRGFSDRVNTTAHDMFDGDWPKNHDVHLISNVLHDWDFSKVRRILGSSFESLLPGGLVVIHDAHINREKSGPLSVASYSAMLMHSTEGKCYSVGEIQGLLEETGFVDVAFRESVVDRSVITASKAKIF